MGRRKNKEPRVSMRVSISQTAHDHLERLLAGGYLGATLPEVAARVLEGRLGDLREKELREESMNRAVLMGSAYGKAGE